MFYAMSRNVFFYTDVFQQLADKVAGCRNLQPATCNLQPVKVN